MITQEIKIVFQEFLKLSNNSPFIIGITGGSGSGKSYLCNKIVNEFGNNNILVILVDSYYKDLSHLKFEEKEKNNFINIYHY